MWGANKMRIIVYQCDICGKEIKEEKVIEITYKHYDDSYGYDLPITYHLCSTKCQKKSMETKSK